MDYQKTSGHSTSTGPRQATSPARLASFRPPRDLSLLSVSNEKLKSLTHPPVSNNKRVFTPNVNVARRKTNASPTITATPKDEETKPRQERGKRPKTKGNFIQTQGVFSEGLSAEKIKNASKNWNDSSPQISKPKLNLARNVSSKEKDDLALKRLMKDDFIDDPSVLPNLNDPPISLPLYFNAKSQVSRSVDSTFEAIQVKAESDMDIFNPQRVFNLFREPSRPKLVVLQFPPELEFKEIKKSGKEAKQEEMTKLPVTNRIANLGEGRWGTLKVLENGKAYIAIGDEKIPLVLTRCSFKQNVMVMDHSPTDARGAVINLGRVSESFVGSSDFTYPSSTIHEWSDNKASEIKSTKCLGKRTRCYENGKEFSQKWATCQLKENRLKFSGLKNIYTPLQSDKTLYFLFSGLA